jgi:hypothetical protein
MKKSLLITSMFIAAAFASQSAMAEIKLRVGKASSSYELGGDYVPAKSTYSPTNFGVTFSSDTSTNGAYLDLGYSTGSGTHNGWATANARTTACGGVTCGNVASPNEEFKRSDFALTGGVVFLNPNNGIAGNVYIGLKTGSTTLGAAHAAVAWTQETFDTVGMIFGGGASFPVAGGRAGSVGVNVGLGIMGATWKDTTGYNVKANSALGGSLGASYTFPFTPNFCVTADYKYHSYSYKFGTTAVPFTVSEKISTLGASLYAKF